MKERAPGSGHWLSRWGLARQLYVLLAIAIVPLLCAVAWQGEVGWRASRELDQAFQGYSAVSAAKLNYRSFVDAAADAVDSGTLSDQGLDALNQAASRMARLAQMADASDGKAHDANEQIGSLQATLTKSHGLKDLMGVRAPMKAFEGSLDGLLKERQARLDDVVQQSVRRASSNTLFMIGTAGISVVLALLIGIRLIRGLTGRLQSAVGTAQRIARGQLDNEIPAGGADEAGQLMTAMREMQSSLNQVTSEIRLTVNSAAQGDFSHLVDLQGLSGFGLDIGRSLNELNAGLQRGIGGKPAHARDVALRIAGGDLGFEIEVAPGGEDSLLAAMATMRHRLEEIISEMRRVVDAAGQGDFGQKMHASADSGFEVTMADLLNVLTDRARSGLQDIVRVSTALADGDLTQKVETNYPGLFGEAQASINTTVDHLRTMMREISESVEVLSVAVANIVGNNDDLAQRTNQQMSMLQQTTDGMEDLARRVGESESQAQKADDLTRKASEVAGEGGRIVSASVTTMNEIAEGSRKITEIIGLIDGIAFQTNILALNAAVEAARAGDQGRGFGVVASEVRSLASRAASAAKDIGALITLSVNKVDGGQRQVGEAGRTISSMVESTAAVSGLMAEIRRSTHAQNSSIEQINSLVHDLKGVADRNSQMVGGAVQITQLLRKEMGKLEDLLSQFRFQPVAPTRGAASVRRPETLVEHAA